jgi:hypothetical protein
LQRKPGLLRARMGGLHAGGQYVILNSLALCLVPDRTENPRPAGRRRLNYPTRPWRGVTRRSGRGEGRGRRRSTLSVRTLHDWREAYGQQSRRRRRLQTA